MDAGNPESLSSDPDTDNRRVSLVRGDTTSEGGFGGTDGSSLTKASLFSLTNFIKRLPIVERKSVSEVVP